VEVRGIASGVSGKGWMGMAPKELAAVMRAVEGAVMMGDEAVVGTEKDNFQKFIQSAYK